MPFQDAVNYADPVAGRRSEGTWGGQRRGAGRKSVLKEAVSFTGDLERADAEALEAIAERRGVSVALLVREAVKAFLKRQKRR